LWAKHRQTNSALPPLCSSTRCDFHFSLNKSIFRWASNTKRRQ
jgi:hypothetical protein